MSTNVLVIYVQIPEPVEIGGMTITPTADVLCGAHTVQALCHREVCTLSKLCMSNSNKHLLKE